ncbi:hypothetical protein AB4259_02760 [Vibrio amylolyticus]|uniref:hypothetical protein n=1 Tax=Vibrio amylolyticus TaxID=2847292 RepID=UPI00354EAF5C
MNSNDDSDTRWFPPATHRYLVHRDGHFWNKISCKRVYVRKDGTIPLRVNGSHKDLIAKDIVDYLFNNGEDHWK